MINPNELRVGNKVLVNGRVTEIFSMAPGTDGRTYGFNLFEGGMPEFYDYDAQPILLTPEILDRCNFENGISLYQYSDNSYGVEIGGFTDQGINVSIEYLHELQNVYYWLSGGQELEIKELQTAT